MSRENKLIDQAERAIIKILSDLELELRSQIDDLDFIVIDPPEKRKLLISMKSKSSFISKNSEAVHKLIALDNMIRYQKRNKDGCAKFNKEQLDAAMQVIEEILKLDHIIKAE